MAHCRHHIFHACRLWKHRERFFEVGLVVIDGMFQCVCREWTSTSRFGLDPSIVPATAKADSDHPVLALSWGHDFTQVDKPCNICENLEGPHVRRATHSKNPVKGEVGLSTLLVIWNETAHYAFLSERTCVHGAKASSHKPLSSRSWQQDGWHLSSVTSSSCTLSNLPSSNEREEKNTKKGKTLLTCSTRRACRLETRSWGGGGTRRACNVGMTRSSFPVSCVLRNTKAAGLPDKVGRFKV